MLVRQASQTTKALRPMATHIVAKKHVLHVRRRWIEFQCCSKENTLNPLLCALEDVRVKIEEGLIPLCVNPCGYIFKWTLLQVIFYMTETYDMIESISVWTIVVKKT